MSYKLAIIHTTPVTIQPLKQLVSEIIPDCTVVNYLDDSILPELIQNGGQLETVEDRWIQYAKYAQQVGAQCILSACSSVGRVVDRAREYIEVPVLRIDEPMMELAVQKGNTVGVAATLSTTLNPSIELLKSKSIAMGKEIAITPLLAKTAYEKLITGDSEGHDRELKNALSDLVKEVDIVVLAQASMARVVSRLSQEEQGKFLSSPRLGIERVKTVLEGKR